MLALCRFLHEGAAMQVFGTGLMAGALMPLDLARALQRPMRCIAVLAALVAAATAPLWLVLVAGSMADDALAGWDPGTLATVLTDTAFGQVWAWHLGLAAVLLAAALAGRRYGPFGLLLAVATALLASLGLIGHALMPPGALGGWHRINQMVHLLAAGAWTGSLLPLLTLLRRLDGPELRQDCIAALRRFSQLGHVAVALVLLTGLTNSWFILGHLPGLGDTPYQHLLWSKIGLVLVMAGLALYNRYRLVPAMRAAPVRSLLLLRRNTALSVLLSAAVLAVTSVLGLVEPR